MSGTLKDRERVTIDQDRCRSATHSLQQSHVDNIPSPFPPRQTPVAARYGLFQALLQIVGGDKLIIPFC